jgi:anaerobic magnesium-protoporphyrin IX monomethyl ester cyclase
MSKILLIKPRYLSLDLQAITQPMGLMYIGAKLKMAGHETKIHDCALDYKNLQILKHTIKDWQPDFIGISIIITEVEQTKKIIALIRETIPDVPVTFGGPWPSADPEESLKTFGADFVVIGEGELVFPELVDALNKGLPTESIPGTASVINGQVKINPGRHLTEDELNSLPFPAWELLDHKLYSKMDSAAAIVGCRPYMAIVTSRGCPFKCAYCHRTMGKVFRKRTAESVLAEMEELRFRHGFKEFEIVDDCFNVDRERMYAILTGIRERLGDVKLHFPNIRADILKPRDMVLFKKAGTVSAGFAIETSSPRLQKMIHKNLNIDNAVLTINAAVKAGIYSYGYFMIGFPTESYREALDTVELAARSTLHRAFFYIPVPFKGTELADMAVDVFKNRKDTIDSRNMNYFNSTLNISAMSDHDLQRVFRRAYRRFYLNPKRIAMLVIHHPRILSFPRYAFLFLIKILPRRSNTAESELNAT